MELVDWPVMHLKDIKLGDNKVGLIPGVKTYETHYASKTVTTKKPLKSQVN